MLIKSSKTKFSVEDDFWFILQWQGNFTISSPAGSGNVILLTAHKEVSYFFVKWMDSFFSIMDYNITVRVKNNLNVIGGWGWFSQV